MLYETKISSIVLRHGLGITEVAKGTAILNPVIIAAKDGKVFAVQYGADGKLSSVTVNGTGVGKSRTLLQNLLRQSGVKIIADASSDSVYSVVVSESDALKARKLLTDKYF